LVTQGGKEQAFDPERVAVLKDLALKPDAYERLARAIAPSIYENEDVKKGRYTWSREVV
jgi:DNA replication licensing factor MCM4